MTALLTKPEIERLVDDYMEHEGAITSTQDILKSGAVSELEKFTVRKGKVSDCIFGGKGSYLVDKDTPTERVVEFENPPLQTRDGIPLILMVRTDRISTHDLNRGSIPFKDQIVAEIHNHNRRLLQDALGTSQFDIGLPDNSVVIAAEKLTQIPVENVVRAYMAKSSTSTSLYQWYVVHGKRGRFAGHLIPNNLFTNGPLPYVMDTPSTKSEKSDETVEPEYLFDTGTCNPHTYRHIRNAALAAFGYVSEYLRKRGIIAVDTKTEHGINHLGEIVSQDEIWTPDSSRFWLVSDYKKQLELFLAGKDEELLRYLKETQPDLTEKDYLEGGRVVITPKSLSKEFARGKSEDDKVYTPEQRKSIAIRYIEIYQELLGRRFDPDKRQRDERVVRGLEEAVKLAA